MGSYYSGDHIAGDHIYIDITICNIEKPQQKYRHRTVSNRLLGRGGIGGGEGKFKQCVTGSKPSSSACVMV